VLYIPFSVVTPKTKNALGIEADLSPTSGSFGTYLSMLKSNGLIEVTGTEVKASDNLFIERLRASRS